MPNYEYKTIIKPNFMNAPYAPSDDTINAQAKDGWELITVCIVPAMLQYAMNEIFYFRRITSAGP